MISKKRGFTLAEAHMILKLKDGAEVEGTPEELARFAKEAGLLPKIEPKPVEIEYGGQKIVAVFTDAN